MSVGAVNKQTGDRIPTAGMPAIDNALDLTSVNPVQNAVITEALAGKADTGIVADDFDSTASYVIGNYCIENGKLYRFKANHSGAWSASDVDEIQITGELATLKSGLTNLDNEVNGDATVYPYADVITIPDAVPSNLADCSVKIEPVQDLHGQSAPYVGGAGDNKLYCDMQLPYSDNGVTITSDNNGGIYINGKTTTAFSINGAFKTASLSGQSTICKFRSYEIEGGSVNYAGTSPAGSYYSSTGGYDTINDSGSWNINLTFPNADKEFDNLHLQPMVIMGNSHPTEFIPYENICPITGHTEASVQRDGGNLIDLADVTGTSGTVYGATKLLPAGTYYGYFFGEYQAWNHFYQYSLDGVNYTNFPTTDDGYAVADVSSGTYYHEKNKMTIHQSAYIRFGIQKNSSVGDNSVDALLTVDSTYYNVINDYTKTGIYYQKMYVPYAGKTYTIALGDTIYGGTVDFDSGVMTVDRQIVDLGSLTWQKVDSASHSRFIAEKVGMRLNGTVIADCFQSSTYGEVYSHTKDEAISLHNTYSQFAVHSTYYEADYDATQFKTAMDGHYACYELATPLTVQLTTQQIQLLKGTNTLTASTGQISVTVNGVSGSIGAVQTQANNTDEALAELAADIAEKLPTAPTTDGAYVLTVTVADGTQTYSWKSAT